MDKINCEEHYAMTVCFDMTKDIKEAFEAVKNQPDKYCILIDGIGNLCVWSRAEKKRIKALWRVYESKGLMPLLALANYINFPVYKTKYVVTKNGLVENRKSMERK